MARHASSDSVEPSGRFLLRVDPALHALLRRAAAEAGVSLNEYCARRLAGPSGSAGATELAPALVRAARMFGDNLAGVALYGSWARGEHTATSDVDLLVVLDPCQELTRTLYRRWDLEPITWNGHPVEPHFVHLPQPDNEIGGTWAEVAVDGVVLFERGLEISTYLRTVRHRIANGELVRKTSHGQPYWSRVA